MVIWLNSAMIVMPQPYPAEQCEAIRKEIRGFSRIVDCIPAPKITIMKDESRVESFGEKYRDCYMNGQALICPLGKVK